MSSRHVRPNFARSSDAPVPVPVPVQTNRTAQTTPSSSQSRTARKLSPVEKALIEQVAGAWAEHQGWRAGKWPSNRRYDAVLITEWVRKLGGPLECWRDIIALAPRGAHFTWLTTPGPAGASRIQSAIISGREARWSSMKKQYAEEAKDVGAVLRRMMGPAS